MAQSFIVRRFLATEADLLRQVRLAALSDTPEAFGATHAHESAQPATFWQGWLAGAPTFGAFVADGTAAGMAVFARPTAGNLAHRGQLNAMYVAPTLRGTGAATALVEALIAHARGEVVQVHLSVNADNDRAHRFYSRMGFVQYGCEPRGLRYAGIDHDVVLMVRMLDGAP